MKKNDLIKLLISIIIPLILVVLPAEAYPIAFTAIEQRIIALFAFAALMWILEPIPIFATSVLVVVLELVFCSNKGWNLFRDSSDPNLGSLLKYQDILHTFADPIIMLFIGGFFLAIAATKYKLDKNIARVILKPFGTNPKFILLGIMIVTAIVSMFMSNTATAAMMIAILAPILACFDDDDPIRAAVALSIPIGANIGGIGTPIGTPPNAIALKYLTGDNEIAFGTFMALGMPYVLVMLAFSWVLLLWMFPSKDKTKPIEIKIEGAFDKSPKAKIVYITFAATILLWMTDFLHGMNSYVVAMLPVGVFVATGVISAKDLKTLSWDVLWLVAGGIALGLGMEESGLAENIIKSIPFDSFSPLIIVISGGLITFVMANFMSNTATANLLIPILAALGTTVHSLGQVGGVTGLLLSAAICASLGMSLPISTPPNAIAYSTGFIQTKDMAKVGLTVGLVGCLVAFIFVYIFCIATGKVI